MSDKISALTEQTSGTLHDDDLLVNVDVSDTTMAASGTNKKSKWSSIKATLKTYFDTLYALASHTHSISDVTSLQTTLDGKAASSHTHAISDVTGLQTALDGKAASSHTHNASDINAGTLDAARLPAPTTTTLGGVMRNAGSAGQFVNGINTDGTLAYGTPAGGAGGGSTNIFIGAGEFIPRTTNGCGINSLETSTNRVNYDVLEFDPAAIEYAQAIRVLPNNWNAGTITFKPIWTAASGSGDVVWSLSARAYANDDAIDQATGTNQTSTDTLTAANDICIGPTSSAITLAGTAANGNPVIFEVARQATSGSDTLAVDARLLGIEITYTAST